MSANGINGRQVAARTQPANRLVLNSLTTSELGTASVGTDELVDASVTPSKLDRAYQEALGTLTKDAEVFRDITGTGVTSSVEVNDEDAASFPDGSTTGIRVAFDIPDELAPGDVELHLRISPSTSVASDFRVEVDYRLNGGALAGATQATVTPSATADVQTLVLAKTFTNGTLASGDGLALLIKRLGADGADTHTGAMRLFRVVLKYPV